MNPLSHFKEEIGTDDARIEQPRKSAAVRGGARDIPLHSQPDLRPAHHSDVAVNIDRDADWLWTGLNGSSTGEYTVNFRLPSGRQLANAEILNTDIVGTANQPTQIGPPPVYRAGSTGPQLTMTDISGAPNTVTLIFSGIRRVRTT